MSGYEVIVGVFRAGAPETDIPVISAVLLSASTSVVDQKMWYVIANCCKAWSEEVFIVSAINMLFILMLIWPSDFVNHLIFIFDHCFHKSHFFPLAATYLPTKIFYLNNVCYNNQKNHSRDYAILKLLNIVYSICKRKLLNDDYQSSCY